MIGLLILLVLAGWFLEWAEGLPTAVIRAIVVIWELFWICIGATLMFAFLLFTWTCHGIESAANAITARRSK